MLEAASLQAKRPPRMVLDLSQRDYDLLAKRAHEQYGQATVESLNQLLDDLGFYTPQGTECDIPPCGGLWYTSVEGSREVLDPI